MKIVKSLASDPVRNLSLEEELLEGQQQDFLLFYINSPSVVVGRNQNPEAEADIEYCHSHGIPVIRRISGGGAVYHDEGNINWSFITARGSVSLLDSNPHTPIITALADVGLSATVGPRGEIVSGGLKISGTASCVRRSRQLFHGTLLFDTDLTEMTRALTGDISQRGRRVPSVRSEVKNIKNLISSTETTRQFADRLAYFFVRYYNAEGGVSVIF